MLIWFLPFPPPSSWFFFLEFFPSPLHLFFFLFLLCIPSSVTRCLPRRKKGGGGGEKTSNIKIKICCGRVFFPWRKNEYDITYLKADYTMILKKVVYNQTTPSSPLPLQAGRLKGKSRLFEIHEVLLCSFYPPAVHCST